MHNHNNRMKDPNLTLKEIHNNRHNQTSIIITHNYSNNKTIKKVNLLISKGIQNLSLLPMSNCRRNPQWELKDRIRSLLQMHNRGKVNLLMIKQRKNTNSIAFWIKTS